MAIKFDVEINVSCSKCGSANFIYGKVEVHADKVCYPITCDNCGNTGEEWHSLKFEEVIWD